MSNAAFVALEECTKTKVTFHVNTKKRSSYKLIELQFHIVSRSKIAGT